MRSTYCALRALFAPGLNLIDMDIVFACQLSECFFALEDSQRHFGSKGRGMVSSFSSHFLFSLCKGKFNKRSVNLRGLPPSWIAYNGIYAIVGFPFYGFTEEYASCLPVNVSLCMDSEIQA